MSSLMIILDVFVILGLVVSAILAVHFEKLLSAIIALSVSGIFAAAAFLIMHAPDVAISEAAVGAALAPLIFIVTIRKITKKGGEGCEFQPVCHLHRGGSALQVIARGACGVCPQTVGLVAKGGECRHLPRAETVAHHQSHSKGGAVAS